MKITGVKIQRPVRKIEPIQIKIIHIAVARLHLSDDVYRTILYRFSGKESSKDMTYFEASQTIDYFKTLGFKIPKRKKYTKDTKALQDYMPLRKNLPPNVFVLPSRDQLKMIDALAGQVIWKVEDGYHRWLKKYFKIDLIKTEAEASDVIEGLKKMIDHQIGS